MNDAFYSLGLTREQLVSLHRASLAQFVMEDTFRREHGEDPQEPPALLAHLERLLDLSADEAHRQFHEEEDRLWEYSWYAYTDEWAWYRARQEVEKELGGKAAFTNQEDLEQQIEAKYEEHFARFTKEIDMASFLDAATSGKTSPSNQRRRSKK